MRSWVDLFQVADLLHASGGYVSDSLFQNKHNHNSYISAISEVVGDSSETCSGGAKDNMGEARMDIIDSRITREFRSITQPTHSFVKYH